MDGKDGRRGRGIAVTLTSTAAGLIGQFLVFLGLLGLGFLIPYEYAADPRASVAIVLGVGVGLVLGGMLSMAAHRGVIAAWMLAGLVLIPFGISMVSVACYYGVIAVPVGAGPLCGPELSLLGIALSTLGAGMFGFGVIRIRGSRTR